MNQENTVNATGQKNAAPKWQKHLEGVRAPEKGARLKGAQAEIFRAAVCAAYKDGAALREIEDHLGRSYGSIRRIVDDAGIMRHRGGYNAAVPAPLTALEWAIEILRNLVVSGTCKPRHKIPALSHLARESGISRGNFQKAALKVQMDGLLLRLPGRGIVALDPKDPPAGDFLKVCVEPGRWETWLIPDLKMSDLEYLRESLIAKMEDGVWPAGSEIPTQAAIKRRFGVTQHAVCLALKSLEESGYLVRCKTRLYVQKSTRRQKRKSGGGPPAEIVDANRSSTPARRSS